VTLRSARTTGSSTSVGPHAVREAVRIAADTLAVAKKARKAKHSLGGQNFCGQKFHELDIQLRSLEPSILRELGAASVPPDLRQQFLDLLKRIQTPTTPIEERGAVIRELRIMGEARIVPLLSDILQLPDTQEVLPLAVVKDTRGYLWNIAVQANGCYAKGWYDAAAVMIRKLVEVLIVELYEGNKREADIKNSAGDFPMLAELIDRTLGDPSWNLSRDTKAVLPKVKALGDRAAHNRRFMARKPDIENLTDGLRVAVDDLLHLSGIRK
jgi:hypothetical protein